MDTLRSSISKLAEYELLSAEPARLYLDLENHQVVFWDQTGCYPRAFAEGKWVKIADVPARALGKDVAAKLLNDSNLAALEKVLTGSSCPEAEHGYDLLPDLNVKTVWDPEDWFEPVIDDLRNYFDEGLTPEEALEREKANLETTEVVVSAEETLNWFRQLWADWAEEEETA